MSNPTAATLVMTPTQRQPSFLVSYLRSNIASFIATSLDFILVFALTELVGVWYVLSTGIGALAGGMAHFILSRHWSFEASHGYFKRQSLRYALVSGSSLLLNCLGVYLITEYVDVHYGVSVFLVSFLVGMFFNFPLHRYFVFR